MSNRQALELIADLVPQGSRLVGHYDSQLKFGQGRVFLAWQMLVFPDGICKNPIKHNSPDDGVVVNLLFTNITLLRSVWNSSLILWLQI